MADSARARSLDKIADLADLHPRCRPQLEARDDRARLHRDDLGFDAEIAQLDFDQARHRLQRLIGIGLLARTRLIEQRQGRQLAGFGRVEQRHLPLALHALALLRHRRRRLDPRRRPGRDFFLLLAHDFLARLLALLAGSEFAPLLDAGCGSSRSPPAPAAPSRSMTSNHETPRNSATPASHSPSSSSVAPRKLKAVRAPSPGEFAEHAAGAVRQRRPAPVQSRKTAAGEQGETRIPRPAAAY